MLCTKDKKKKKKKKNTNLKKTVYLDTHLQNGRELPFATMSMS